MFNYICSELYRYFRQRAFWGLLIFCAAVVLIVGFSTRWSNLMDYTAGEEMLHLGQIANRASTFLEILVAGMSFGSLFFVLFLPSIVLKERGIHVQLISFGLRRSQVFFGDLILQTLVTVITAISVTAFSLLSYALFFLTTPGVLPLLSFEAEGQFCTFLRQVPLLTLALIGLNAITICCYYLFNNKAWSYGASIAVGIIIPQVLNNMNMFSKTLQESWLCQFYLHHSPFLRYMETLNLGPTHAPDIAQAVLLTLGLCALIGYSRYRIEEI